MARATCAGDLSERVTFSEPVRGSDGGGGVHDGFAVRFKLWAQFTHLRGGEAVLAARLAGRHAMVIRVRASSDTRRITNEWRATDRSGTVFNIRDVSPSTDRAWLDFLCESGVAA